MSKIISTTDIENNSKKFYIKIFSEDFILFLILLFLVLLFSLLNRNFYSLPALKILSINIGRDGLVVIGVALVMITRNIDISVGSMVGLTSAVTALIFSFSYFSGGFVPTIIGVVLIMVTGGILGCINAVFIVGLGLNSVITTLATMAIFRGLSYFFIGGKVLYIYNPFFLSIGRGIIANRISVSLILLLVSFPTLFITLKYTKFGQNIRAIGGNERIAYIFGIRVKGLKFIVFIVSGILAGLTSIIICGQIGAGAPEYGIGMELDAIIITVLGGFSLKGGKGSAIGLFFALLIMEVFTIGVVILGFSLYLRYVARGLILITILALNIYKEKKKQLI